MLGPALPVCALPRNTPQTATAIAGRCVSAMPSRAQPRPAAICRALQTSAHPKMRGVFALPNCTMPRPTGQSLAVPCMAQTDCRTRERMRCVCWTLHCCVGHCSTTPRRTRLPPTVARARCVWQASHSLASHSNRPAVLRKPRTFRTSDATRQGQTACPPSQAPLPATSWRRCCHRIR